MYKIRDRVVLKEDSKWEPSKGNPKQGSEFACEGIIKSKSGMYYSVLWDNNILRNGYVSSDFLLIRSYITHKQITIPPLRLFHAFNRPYIKER